MRLDRVLAVACAAVLPVFAAQASERTVLAVPSRHDLVNFAFDIADMYPREVELACYDQRGGPETLRLFLFDRAAWRWQDASIDSWRSGGLFGQPAPHLIVVGDQPAAATLKRTTWAASVQGVDGKRLDTLVNALNRPLQFTAPQWQQLSQTYGFTLTDRNEGLRRRRFGRRAEQLFGRGEAPAAAAPMRIEAPVMEEELPPAQPVEAVEAPPAPPAPSAEEPAATTTTRSPAPTEAPQPEPLPEDK